MPLYGATVVQSLTEAGFTVRTFTVPHGEVAKTPKWLIELIEYIEYIEGYEAHQSPGKTRSGLLPTGASLAVSACAFGLVSGSRPDADLMLLTSSSASRLR